MAQALGVTATAIRNRLVRLVGSGLVDRKTESVGRGRPRHTYTASAETHKRLGQNYADLALALADASPVVQLAALRALTPVARTALVAGKLSELAARTPAFRYEVEQLLAGGVK